VREERERKHRLQQEHQLEIYNSRTPISEHDLKILTPEQQREYDEIANKVSFGPEGLYTTRQFQKKTIVSEERERKHRFKQERQCEIYNSRTPISEDNLKILTPEQQREYEEIAAKVSYSSGGPYTTR
jgi:hypothetical protein